METALFYLFSGITLISSVFVIAHPRPTRSLLSLILAMLSLAVLFVLLGAPFVAMVHLITYAGAVLVLFLFVIMLQGIGARDVPLFQRFKPIHLLTSGIVVILLLFALMGAKIAPSLQGDPGFFGSVETVAHLLFNKYLLPFELVSILVLLGIFAAVTLAKEENE